MMFAPAFVRVVLTWPVGWFLRGRLLLASRMTLPLVRDAGVWWRQTRTNRTLLAVAVTLTLVVETLSCLLGPQHPLKLTPAIGVSSNYPGNSCRGYCRRSCG